MRFFGFDFSAKRADPPVVKKENGLRTPTGHWSTIFDFDTLRWQQDAQIDLASVLTFSPVFACMRLIASDIGKMRIKLLQREDSGIWTETDNPAYSPLLRKPNPSQIRIKFIESWIFSKLQFGNTYVMKQRDNRGVVRSLRVLDATRVTPLVSDSGDTFYRLRHDLFTQIPDEITVPASEIIHDVHMTPEHPLIGVSPIGAAGLAASQGLSIQKNSNNTFSNQSRPSGILTAPGAISNETAALLKTNWEANYGGENSGKTAVVGDGLEYKPISMSPSDTQLIEQLGWTGEDVCRAFGVPPYKVGIGQMPAFNNIEALDQAYYSQTLQEFIECIEAHLDEGLSLSPGKLRTEFDLDQLLRMDSLTRAKIMKEKISAGILSPNEGRKSENLSPVSGGESPYLQQQNFSLAALAKRDAQDDPFKTSSPAATDEPEIEEEDDDPEELEKDLMSRLKQELAA